MSVVSLRDALPETIRTARLRLAAPALADLDELVALADKFGLPIHAIGVGEQIDDLQPFDPEDFAAALTGIDS